MCRYVINGGRKLKGIIDIEGSKNAVLPILAASLLNSGVSVIHNCPDLRDVRLMLDIIKDLGCKVQMSSDTVIIDSKHLNNCNISRNAAIEMRSSIIFLGAVLSRMNKAVIPKPGGCDIGLRPIDLHKTAFEMMDAEIDNSDTEFINARTGGLKGCEINLEYPSVGATENIMIAAVLASGETVIKNAAKEPEIVDLQNFLNAMGAKIKGAGNNLICIKGVNEKDLHGVEYTVIPDRIVAGTYMAAAAVTGGDIIINNVIEEHILPIIKILKDTGCKIYAFDNKIMIKGPKNPVSPGSVVTMPYPEFPTDMQPQIISVMAVSEGESIVEETVFECRFKHIDELVKMGADIKTEGNKAYIKGISQLKGAPVISKDLRGGAALIIAGLNAKGKTVIDDLRYIERGYVSIEKKLAKVGAEIIRI